MLLFVKLIISCAISTSRIREFASDRFSCVVPKLLIVCSRRFCAAPRSARCAETALIASSIFVIGLFSTLTVAAAALPSSEAVNVAKASSYVFELLLLLYHQQLYRWLFVIQQLFYQLPHQLCRPLHILL